LPTHRETDTSTVNMGRLTLSSRASQYLATTQTLSQDTWCILS